MRLRHNEPKILFTFCFLSLALVVLLGCSQPSGTTGELKGLCEELVEPRIELLSEEPNLTDEQVKKLNQVDSLLSESCDK